MIQNSIRKRHEGEDGFTLVELLVVIVILGVLAGIVVFAVGGVTNKSAQAGCKADVSTVQTAEEAFYAQNNAYTSIQGLVNANLIRSAPSNSDYAISVDATTGAVTATPACSTL